jgi:site-specific DNA recombinase
MRSTNGHGLKRAVLYARVSTEEQARSGYSLAQQMEALREYATREGCEILEEVTDRGQSGASLERPGMDRVRDLVAAGGVSIVLAQDRDRFIREPAYHYLLRREFEEYGCSLQALNDRGDDSPEGQLTDGIMDQLAKFERAKFTERSRRGKIRKIREGKIMIARYPRYGFKFNAGRNGYEVDEPKMQVVRRIFDMVAEGHTFKAIKRTLEAEGVPTASGGVTWDRSFIRRCIFEDAYRPHSCEEVAAVVSPDVAARLDPEKRYGLWWFNRRGIRVRQVSEASEEGRRYKKKYTQLTKPKEEWVAVPVPDAGVPRAIVERAREAGRQNKAPSRAASEFWELSGGLIRCGHRGKRMTPVPKTKTYKDKRYVYRYYRCSRNRSLGSEACPNKKRFNAKKVEQRVRAFVDDVLLHPARLKAGLERYIRDEREAVLLGDTEREAKGWAERIAAADRQRARYQQMAAEELITFSELKERLEELRDAKIAAQGELDVLTSHKEQMAELERSVDELLSEYASITPKILTATHARSATSSIACSGRRYRCGPTRG